MDAPILLKIVTNHSKYIETMTLAFFIIAYLLALYPFSPSFAATEVEPTRLNIQAGSNQGRFIITNHGEDPQEYHVDAFLWEQDDINIEKLTKSQDVEVDKKTLLIGPHQSESVSVFIPPKSPAEKEESYRILIEESQSETEKNTGGLHVKTKITVPIFRGGNGDGRDVVVYRGYDGVGEFTFGIKNAGISHFFVKNIIVEGRNEGGRLFLVQRGGWYVLHDAFHDYHVRLSREDCSKVKYFRISVELLDGYVSKSTFHGNDRSKCTKSETTEFFEPPATGQNFAVFSGKPFSRGR